MGRTMKTETLKLRWQDWSADVEDGISIGRKHAGAIEKAARKTKKPRIIKVHDKVNPLQ